MLSVTLVTLQTSAFYSTDVSAIGVGARTMGMGKAFVALANDNSTIFMNPSGLAQVEHPEILSMHTSLLNEINYFSFAGSLPVGPGVLGIGLLQSSIDDIALTQLDSNDRPKVTERVTYADGLAALSYGLSIKEFLSGAFNCNIEGKVFGGVSAKYFQKGVTDLAVGNGVNADLGLLYIPNEYWSIGLAQKNVLGAAGPINWDTGARDELTSYTTLGLGYAINQAWKILTDYDFSFSNKRMGLFHVGTEYRLDSYLTLRCGWEQINNAVSDKPYDHITAGLSLRLGGLSVDYAYQPYYGMTEDTTQYISFGYIFGAEQLTIYSADATDEGGQNVK